MSPKMSSRSLLVRPAPSLERLPDRLIENGQSLVDLRLAAGKRRRDPPNARQARQGDDVHGQAELEAALRDLRAERRIGPAAVPVAHQLDAPQQAAPAHVADHLVALLQLAQARFPARAELQRSFREPL